MLALTSTWTIDAAYWMGTLVDTSLRASLVLLGAGMLAAVLRRASAATRHLVWTVAIGGVLLLPAVTDWVPTITLPVRAPATVPAIARDTKPVSIPAGALSPSPGLQAPSPPDTGERVGVRGLDAPITAMSPGAGRIPHDVAGASPDVTMRPRDPGTPPVLEQPAPVAEGGQRFGSFFSSTSLLALMLWIADLAFMLMRNLPSLLLTLWLAGTMVLLTRLAAGVARVAWLTRRSESSSEPDAQRFADESRHDGRSATTGAYHAQPRYPCADDLALATADHPAAR